MLVLLPVCGLAGSLSAASSAAVHAAGHSALVRVDTELCISPCGVGGVGICTPSEGCIRADRVAAIDADRRRVATVRLQHHRFKLHLVPGRYTLELLGDGKHVHGQVMQEQKVRATAQRTTYVHFGSTSTRRPPSHFCSSIIADAMARYLKCGYSLNMTRARTLRIG
jgi:hypothetical protein